jgi:hypothetical protein
MENNFYFILEPVMQYFFISISGIIYIGIAGVANRFF